jgi:MtfA peptidase
VQVLVAEKNWEGCHGLTLTEEMKVTIAAQACLLVVALPEDIYFDHVLSILVYPTGYIAPETPIGRGGIVIDEGGQARLGEAWWRGPVILSWEHALAGGRLTTPGHNLVLHEFAHQLDMMNGRTVDGTPQLSNVEQMRRWAAVMEPAYQQLIHECEHDGHGFIDCYGATNRAEFFAVLTESFFERPESLKSHKPQVYEVLSHYYRLDPASWAT